ncbi:P-loop NTPase [Eggerthellaceae bacterium zg-997]|nr:P-loop NTPase [Eggerthellaceae bacterium zg-997]
MLQSSWLTACASADEARRVARDQEVDEAWVVDPEDVEPINLAATLKVDRPSLRVALVSFRDSGSLRSRAHAARLDALYGRPQFVKSYLLRKQRALGLAPADGARIPGSATPSVASDADSTASDSDVSLTAGQKARDSRASQGSVGLARSIRRGFAETRAPLAAPRTAAASGAARRSPASRAARGQTDATVVALASGSGGVGKSTLAVVLAGVAAQRGLHVAVIDADLQFGDVAQLAVGVATVPFSTAVEDDRALAAAREADGMLVAVVAPERVEDSDRFAQRVGSLVERAARLFDVVVVNTGSFWADAHVELMRRSTCPVLLMDQRISSLRSCRHALELCMRCGVATGPFTFVVNRTSRRSRLSGADASRLLDGVPVCEVRDGGSEVEELLSAGSLFELVDGRSDFQASVAALADRLGLCRETLAPPGGSDAKDAKAGRGLLFAWGSRGSS